MKREIVSTGIYGHELLHPESREDWGQIVAELQRAIDTPPVSNMRRLADVEESLCRIVSPWVVEGSEDKPNVGWTLCSDPPPAIKDAADTLIRLQRLCDQIPDEQTAGLVLEAFRLGRMREKVQVRQFEPLVQRAKRQAEPLAKGKAKRQLESENRIRDAIAAVRAKLAANPRLTITAARTLVARDMEISPRTVTRHTKGVKR